MQPEQETDETFRRRARVATIGGLGCITLLVIGGICGDWYIRARQREHLCRVVKERGVPVVDAVLRFRSDNGQYPEQLDELVPGYLPAVPVGQCLLESYDAPLLSIQVDWEAAITYGFAPDTPWSGWRWGVEPIQIE